MNGLLGARRNDSRPQLHHLTANESVSNEANAPARPIRRAPPPNAGRLAPAMTGDATSPGRDGPPPMPRWVKLFVLVAVVLLLLVVLLLAVGHGPGDHAPGMLVGVAGVGYPRARDGPTPTARRQSPARRR